MLDIFVPDPGWPDYYGKPIFEEGLFSGGKNKPYEIVYRETM
jgi:hypothetical protein